MIFSMVHLCMLVASHMKSTTCHKSISCRLLMLFNLILLCSLNLFASYIVWAETEELSPWYMWTTGILSTFLLACEGLRSLRFNKALKEQEMRDAAVNDMAGQT